MAAPAKSLSSSPDAGVAFSRAAYALLELGYSNTELIVLIREQRTLLRSSKKTEAAKKPVAPSVPATGNAAPAQKTK